MSTINVAHGKTTMSWCDKCGTLILGEQCDVCRSHPRHFEINSPGDIRPAMKDGVELVLSLFREHFGTSSPLTGRMIFFNKIPGEDRTDEIVAHGDVIAVLRYNIVSNSYELDLRQRGAEIFADVAKKNVITLGKISGHMKGKSFPGSVISSVSGRFGKGDPLILLKGTKIGAGVAQSDSDTIRASEKAIKIKDMDVPSDIRISSSSDRRTFVNSNGKYLSKMESRAASDIKSFLATRKEPVTVSFSGGKDSLAAFGVTMNVVRSPELIFVNTGIEFPETVRYVHDFVLEHRLRLHEADAGNAFWDNVETFGPPAKDFRWCCKVCKLGPIAELISSKYPKGTITVEGNRGLESFARSKLGFVSKNPFVPNQTALNPIREWTSSDVWAYIWWKGFRYNPLYEKDFERIGCHLCASSLSSEWAKTKTTHPAMHSRWESFLMRYAASNGLPVEYVIMSFWRWKVLPPKMIRLAEDMDLKMVSKNHEGPSVKMLKGASPCAAGGYSIDAIVNVPKRRDFVKVVDALRTIGDVSYSQEFEIALLRTKKGTSKLFGGGQVSVTSSNAENVEHLFERSVKAILRAQMCTSCGICAKRCPRNAIIIEKGLSVNKDRCNSCGICEKSCMVAHYYDKMV